MSQLFQSAGTGAPDFLRGGGEMAKAILAKDWSATALGPIQSWPQSLRTTVSLCLASNFPISIAWGPDRIQIYNDGYWPICGAKHPHSMGQDFKECWFSAWPEIGDAFERALEGKTSYIEDQRMFLDRNGYLEETFFTFSFSPIRDETGGVGGLFHPVTETTAKMLSERRTRALRDLSARTTEAKTEQEACGLAAQVLADYSSDLPFVLIYAIGDHLEQARLAGTAGIEPGTPASPSVIDLTSEKGIGHAWHMERVAHSGQPELVEDVERHFGPLSSGPYLESCHAALVLPISGSGLNRPAGILVAGVSSRRPLDDSYRGFYELVVGHLGTSLANARAYEGERRKADALAELDRAKTAFFSNVSHEFRTPLTLMLGPLEDLLARGGLQEGNAWEELQLVHRNGLRLLKLVNTLLDFSRIEAGREQAIYEPIDLGTLTADLASAFRSAVERVGLRIVVSCPPLPEPVYVDREMWEKVVLNLVSNAFKFTFEGEIGVTLRLAGDHVQLLVSDTGTGIDERELPRIFERFHRIQGAQARTHEGTGIGLALVQELARLHGGSISAASRLGEGSTFTVMIPRGKAHLSPHRIQAARDLSSISIGAQPYVEEALRWTPDEPSRRSEENPGNRIGSDNRTDCLPVIATAPAHGPPIRGRILLADDNADMRDYVCRLLGPHYEVEAVPDGEAALATARQSRFDLVLTDVMMPRLDGFALLRELRGHPDTKTIPVILLSARAGEESRLEGLEAGADDYLIKPFTSRELLGRVDAHLRLARMRREFEGTLQEKNTELERASQAKDEFLASMSHELRTPLNAIIGFTGTLLMKLPGPLTAEQNKQLQTIRSSATHLLSLINDLLDLAKIGSGKINLFTEAVALESVVEKVCGTLRPLAESKGLALGATAPEYQIVLSTDRRAVSQILLNLANNAIKFTERGQVHIVLSREEIDGKSWVQLSVHDTGIGIRAEHQSGLFEAFGQIEDADSRYREGTGLGLHLSRKLAELLGGQINIKSEYGKGSTFTLSLPFEQGQGC